eukprot:761121-Hanusia_phi.AAC.1
MTRTVTAGLSNEAECFRAAIIRSAGGAAGGPGGSELGSSEPVGLPRAWTLLANQGQVIPG